MTPAKIPVTKREQHEVLVVGGGIAGISAAVSSARAGADVLRGHDLLLCEGKTLGRSPKVFLRFVNRLVQSHKVIPL